MTRFALLSVPALLLSACGGGAPAADPQVVARGRAIFEGCSTCHSLNGETKVGPSLGGVVGRKAGSMPGFAYSDALKNGQFEWTPQKLEAFLSNLDTVPGTNMAITPLSPAQSKDVVTYLSTTS